MKDLIKDLIKDLSIPVPVLLGLGILAVMILIYILILLVVLLPSLYFTLKRFFRRRPISNLSSAPGSEDTNKQA